MAVSPRRIVSTEVQADPVAAHSLAPPPPPIRARPTPMDEERKAPAISPEPPDEGDPTPVSQPSSNKTTTSEIANSPNPKPCPRPEMSQRGVHPFVCLNSGLLSDCCNHEAHTYTEPLILRLNGTPERLRGDDEDKWSSRLSHTELTTPSKSITCFMMSVKTLPNSCDSGLCDDIRAIECVWLLAHEELSDNNLNQQPDLRPPATPSHSSKRSKSSSKSNSSQIPAESQDDCCVHCILAGLFCEFLTLCNIVLDCATCGSCAGDDSCFCCCCASEECGDCELPCDMDCGIIDACCESADCLEICM
ncbi:hypothetical protein JOQ06_014852, partial [Pogonophryne albipinna]